MSNTWVITLSGSRPIELVVEDAKQAGLTIRRVLHEIGTIVGDGSEEIASRIRNTKGVADVSIDRPIGIVPPASGNE